MEHATPSEFEAAVIRARARAARTGELDPKLSGSFATSVTIEVADFLERILTDGTYSREVARIGEEDPDLASI